MANVKTTVAAAVASHATSHGASAFYVSHRPHYMRIAQIVIGAALISVFAIACSTDSGKQQPRTASSSQAIDAGTPQTRLDQVAKEYGLVVHGHEISFMLPGLTSVGGEDALMKENMEKVQKITDAVHRALGDDSTNYVIRYKIR